MVKSYPRSPCSSPHQRDLHGCTKHHPRSKLIRLHRLIGENGNSNWKRIATIQPRRALHGKCSFPDSGRDSVVCVGRRKNFWKESRGKKKTSVDSNNGSVGWTVVDGELCGGAGDLVDCEFLPGERQRIFLPGGQELRRGRLQPVRAQRDCRKLRPESRHHSRSSRTRGGVGRGLDSRQGRTRKDRGGQGSRALRTRPRAIHRHRTRTRGDARKVCQKRFWLLPEILLRQLSRPAARTQRQRRCRERGGLLPAMQTRLQNAQRARRSRRCLLRNHLCAPFPYDFWLSQSRPPRISATLRPSSLRIQTPSYCRRSSIAAPPTATRTRRCVRRPAASTRRNCRRRRHGRTPYILAQSWTGQSCYDNTAAAAAASSIRAPTATRGIDHRCDPLSPCRRRWSETCRARSGDAGQTGATTRRAGRSVASAFVTASAETVLDGTVARSFPRVTKTLNFASFSYFCLVSLRENVSETTRETNLSD